MGHANLKTVSKHILMTTGSQTNIILNAPLPHKHLQHLIKIIVTMINTLKIIVIFEIIHLNVKAIYKIKILSMII